jgi:hypothetical protein
LWREVEEERKASWVRNRGKVEAARGEWWKMKVEGIEIVIE